MGKRTNPGFIIPIYLVYVIISGLLRMYFTGDGPPLISISILVIFVILDLARGKVKGWNKSILVRGPRPFFASIGTLLDSMNGRGSWSGSNQHPPQLPQSSFPGADGGNSMGTYRCPMGHTMTSITIPPSCPFCGKPMIPN